MTDPLLSALRAWMRDELNPQLQFERRYNRRAEVEHALKLVNLYRTVEDMAGRVA
jgi:hypothetical protein